jgi:hypothetical protein
VKRKEILDYIQESGGADFQSISRFFACGETKGKTKQLARILSEFEEEGVLQYQAEGDRFLVLVREKKVREPAKAAKLSVKKEPKPKRNKMDAIEDMDGIIREYEIRNEFPPNALKEAESIPEFIPDRKSVV